MLLFKKYIFWKKNDKIKIFQISRLGSRSSSQHQVNKELQDLVDSSSNPSPGTPRSYSSNPTPGTPRSHSSPKECTESRLSLVAKPCIIESGSWVILDNYHTKFI